MPEASPHTEEIKAKASSGLTTRILSGLVITTGGLSLIYMGGWFFTGLLVIAFLIAIYEWDHIARAGTHTIPVLLGGVLYLCACFTAFYMLRQTHEYGLWLALMLIIAIGMADSMAYFAGRTFKGPKMAPKISPKKTWSGFCGSVFGAGLVFLVMGGLIPAYTEGLLAALAPKGYSVIGVALFGCVMGCLGQVGDLLVSYFKRRGGLKDAGHLIPGHGGILDRIDSHLLAALVFVIVEMGF